MKKLIVLSTLLLVLLLVSVNFITSTLINNNKKVLVHEAIAHFESMVSTRMWNAQHGGVYVKAHKNIKPNPYLKDNTLKTARGETLIKINPAWMTRQISTISNAAGNYYYKITSLKPINPDNIPDTFEKRALEHLEQARSEKYYYEFDTDGSNSRYFNFMGALVTTKSCLECHASQGYKVGDIRGGIRVSIPTIDVVETNRFIQTSKYAFMLFILLLFALFLVISHRHLKAKKLKENAEQKLLDREKELSKILLNLKGVIYKARFDEQRTLLFVSHEIQNISGYDSDELVENRHLSFIDLISEKDRGFVLQSIEHAAETDGSFEIEYRITARDGKEKWLWEEGNIIDNETIEGYISDITEKKCAEKEIEITKKRLEQAQQIAHVGSWGMNINTHTTWWSDEMYKIFQVKPLLFTPTFENFLEFVHAEDREQVQATLSQTILSHEQSDLYFRILRSDGEVRYIHAQSEIVQEENTLDIVGTMFDITERRIAEIKQQEQEQLLIQQSKMAEMGEMVAAIAHQWKQPLNIIGLNIQEIKDAYEYKELDEKYIGEITQVMMAQLHYMNDTIDDFRNFFKPSKTKETFTVRSAVEEVANVFSAQLKNNNITLDIQCDSKTPYEIFGRKNEFKQVILIIINNAKDAIKMYKKTSGDKALKGVIHFNISRQRNMLHLQISDNGGGIDPNILPRLFTPYLTTKGDAGTGIGLKLAKTIIETGFNGTITAANYKEGARFDITIDLA